MLEVKAKIVSTGEEAAVEINIMEQAQTDHAAIDVSKWKDSPYAKKFRTVIRRAERRLKNENLLDFLYRADLEDALYDLKCALIDEDLELAEVLEEEIMDMLGE